ncbi:MAG TPA: acetyl-CoA C-acyltransferase [Oligoflexia bacterium]|nr:acetyl-CoA C-acyltransferase [Oligoflexia bacterium]HMP27915.1 acetyl-CoA C-acyltransferase [Oligoflexia bacterium]
MPSNRTAIIATLRTPFVKAGGVFANLRQLDLSLPLVNELAKRVNHLPEVLVFGSVLLDPTYPNLARELILRSDLPKGVEGHFVSNNCITGIVAATVLDDGIRRGRWQIGFCGGVESMSNPALTFRKKAQEKFLKLFRAKNTPEKFLSLASFRPSDFLPLAPSPKEPSTGLTMGEHCEIMAKEFGIQRNQQDEFACGSHQKAAINSDFLKEDILPFGNVASDNLIRANTTIEKLANLKSVFDRSSAGSLTAGNSSALTDGASLACLANENFAHQNNLPILGYIEDVEFAAIEPSRGLLMAPVLAISKLLEKNNLKISEIDLFEIHEAFAAQVLSNIKVLEEGSPKFPELVNRYHIPREKLNIHGGSIALGHPFAATGGRLISAAARTLRKTNGKRALISVCAAGAMAAAVLISSK